MASPAETEGRDYRYEEIEPAVLLGDMAFAKEGPEPGSPVPTFSLTTIDGERLTSASLFGKPYLLIFGSITCPMTEAAMPDLKRLHEEYGDVVEFIFVYVREAHPGGTYSQPHELDHKIRHARHLRDELGVPFTVAADDIDGSLHRALDDKPNAVYLVDKTGLIAFRALWAGDDKAVGEAIDAVVRGETPDKRESTARFIPIADGLGKMREVFKRAGPGAEADMWKAAPPMAATARLAEPFGFLPPRFRTFAAFGLMALAGGLIYRGLRHGRRRRRRG